MSDIGVELSALPAAAPLDGTETFPLVQGGVTKRTTGLAPASHLTDAAAHIGTLERLVYEVEKFGSLTGTATVTTAAIQAAVDAWGATGGILRFPKNAPVLTINARIALPETVPAGVPTHAVFEIEGNGTTIKPTGAIDAMGDTVPASLNAAVNRTSRHFKIHGLRFVGDGTAGQRGLVLHGTYGAEIDCSFLSLDTGLDLLFALMPRVRGFAHSCRSYGFRARSLSQVAPAYATGSNSGSNVGVLDGWRDYGYAGMIAQLDFFEANSWKLRDIITEGNNPQHGIRFNGNGNTTVKNFTIDGWHDENAPTVAGLKVTGLGGGVVRVKGAFYQLAQTLIDASGLGSTVTIAVEDLAYYVSDSVPFKGDVNGAAWMFVGHHGLRPRDSTLWVGGVVPNYLSAIRWAHGSDSMGGTYLVVDGGHSARITANYLEVVGLMGWNSSGPAPANFNSQDVAVVTVGKGLRVKEGTNAKQGVATLSSGTVTVANTAVTANSRILLTVQSLGTVTAPKAIAVTGRTAGTSFTITSADATDTSVVAWEIFEPA